MLRLLERNIRTLRERMIIVAPESEQRIRFGTVTGDSTGRRTLLHAIQRFRGAVYQADGAIRCDQLTRDGRHSTPEDEKSWHLLFLDPSGCVSACVWFLDHGFTPAFDRLRVRSNPLTGSVTLRRHFINAVEGELNRARQEGLSYAELGGWAVAQENRCTADGLLLALGAYSLGRLLGGALGMTTATVRHASSSILRRLGGTSLEVGGETVPSYYDPHYKCVMELLRFDSRRPNARYERVVELLRTHLLDVPIVALGKPDASQLASAVALPAA